MFARWFRKREKPLPDIAMPDLDREVSERWGRGVPSSPAPPPDNSASLDFTPGGAYGTRKTKEGARRRRRLFVSLLVGLILGPILVAATYYLMRAINPRVQRLQSLGERMTFGAEEREEIFYTDDISDEQVRRLGAFLQRAGIFDGISGACVRMSKSGDVFAVGFAVEWNLWKNEEVVRGLRALLSRMSKEVFNGSFVEIHMCACRTDSKGRPLPTMRVIRADELIGED